MDVCRDGDGCVSVAEDDSTGMTAFGFVSGGCRGGLCSLYGQAARCRKRIFCCRRPYFFCKFLMSNGFFFFYL